jgi:hypothetical protein
MKTVSPRRIAGFSRITRRAEAPASALCPPPSRSPAPISYEGQPIERERRHSVVGQALAAFVAFVLPAVAVVAYLVIAIASAVCSCSWPNGDARRLRDDAPGRNRTCDLALRRRALYPLSYGRSEGPVY